MFRLMQRNSSSFLHAADKTTYGKPTPTQIAFVLLGLRRCDVLKKEHEVEGTASGVG
jgi:hypothetical protein